MKNEKYKKLVEQLLTLADIKIDGDRDFDVSTIY